MRVGIVGADGQKWTVPGEVAARALIRDILVRTNASEVVSGRCHLGGVDIWAAEIGHALGLKVTEFPPAHLRWEDGFKPRNLKIIAGSDAVHCITVDRLPDDYTGSRMTKCFHCMTEAHARSGGCWVVAHAMKAGKFGVVHVIENK